MSNCHKDKKCEECWANVKRGHGVQKCEFWFPEDSVMTCHDPATYKMTHFNYSSPRPHDMYVIWYCKEHYELMAATIMSNNEDKGPEIQRRVQECIEINNWFQHE